MDGYDNSGVMILFSDHLGVKTLVTHERKIYCNDEDDEGRVHVVVEAMIEGDVPLFIRGSRDVPRVTRGRIYEAMRGVFQNREVFQCGDGAHGKWNHLR
jgi:hypothetical protein